jgi:hypothetical protein
MKPEEIDPQAYIDFYRMEKRKPDRNCAIDMAWIRCRHMEIKDSLFMRRPAPKPLPPRTHLETIGESYGIHLRNAWRISRRMIWGGICALIHGILPSKLTKAASTIIAELHSELQERSGRM